jgi:hypothetical protein
MSDTEVNVKKRSSLMWQIFQAVVAALFLGLSGWVLHTVESLQVKVASIESANRENMAQWKALSDLSEKAKHNEIEVMVNHRLFEMLLDQQTIQIKSRKEEPKKYGSVPAAPREEDPIPELSRKDRVDAFREDQIRQFTREQMQQRTFK